MGGGGKCGKQETIWEGGSRADLCTGSGGMTKTEEGQVGTTGHNGSPGETELSSSADGLDVGYDGWRSQGQPVWLMVGAPLRSLQCCRGTHPPAPLRVSRPLLWGLALSQRDPTHQEPTQPPTCPFDPWLTGGCSKAGLFDASRWDNSDSVILK